MSLPHHYEKTARGIVKYLSGPCRKLQYEDIYIYMMSICFAWADLCSFLGSVYYIRNAVSFWAATYYLCHTRGHINYRCKRVRILKRKRGGLIIQSRDYAVVQRRCCLCYSSCRQSTSGARNTLLTAIRFQVWQTQSKSYRYNPTIYETTIKRRIKWYNQINEIPIIKRKFFLSKIFCLEKIYFRFFLSIF